MAKLSDLTGNRPANPAAGTSTPKGEQGMNDNKATTPAPATNTAPAATAGFAGISFEDAAEMPDAGTLALAVNPFADKVAELARTGKAAKVVLPDGDVKAARDLIRRAANAINKGAKTRTVPAKGSETTHTEVWFSVGDMTKRPRKS